jgi:hypothetical protein
MIQNHLLWTGEECKELSQKACVPDSISGDKNCKNMHYKFKRWIQGSFKISGYGLLYYKLNFTAIPLPEY